MTRKQRLEAKHAAGRGKGRPTPRNTPGSMTRRGHIADTISSGRRSTKDALGLLLREAGGVLLDPKEKR